MPFIIFFLSLHLMAAEVTTLNLTRNKSELVLMTTDENPSLQLLIRPS